MEHHDGYAGYILNIDLSTRCVHRIPLSDAYRRLLLGGKALAARLMLDCLTGNEAALSEDNIVVIATAPLTGTGAPGSARFDIGSLSPKDDLPAISNCGGNLGALLKAAGCDGLILKGRCDRPTWLEISGDHVRFHPAGDLWGLGTGACREYLTKKLEARRFASLCIGPAGEHLVKFASVLADGHSTGRAGLGAVLGWKQLKAVTVEGDRSIPLHDPATALETNRRWHSRLRELAAPETGGTHCTACPLHCTRRNRGKDPLLEELGMDAIAAKAAAQGMEAPELYRAIAFRQGIGNRLAEGVESPKGIGGKRRNADFPRITDAFGWSGDDTERCKNFTEAICTLGQCMFTANVLCPGPEELPLLSLIRDVTGTPVDLDALLAIGVRSRQLERQLRERFDRKNTSA